MVELYNYGITDFKDYDDGSWVNLNDPNFIEKIVSRAVSLCVLVLKLWRE